jgi:aryl-alcohol dehydrogenase-like predicted oxidoreductase
MSSDVGLSRIGFGTGGLLRIGSARERQSVLAAAFANGVTHFDTAPIYGFGEAERSLGRFLRGRRASATLTTKFGLQPSWLAARLAPLQRVARKAIKQFPMLRRAAVRNTAPLYATPSFSAPAVRASLESSLRSLGTDYVDFFLAHQASAECMPADDVIGVLDELRQAGKIRAFGIATEFNWVMPVLNARPRLAGVVQFDSEVGRGHVAALPVGPEPLIITYGFINRAISACRQRMNSVSLLQDLARVDDDTLGGLLLRAAVVENPRGIVLMQSRSISRIERNVRAAHAANADQDVRKLVQLLELQR